jgi:hypothetical protein
MALWTAAGANHMAGAVGGAPFPGASHSPSFQAALGDGVSALCTVAPSTHTAGLRAWPDRPQRQAKGRRVRGNGACECCIAAVSRILRPLRGCARCRRRRARGWPLAMAALQTVRRWTPRQRHDGAGVRHRSVHGVHDGGWRMADGGGRMAVVGGRRGCGACSAWCVQGVQCGC